MPHYRAVILLQLRHDLLAHHIQGAVWLHSAAWRHRDPKNHGPLRQQDCQLHGAVQVILEFAACQRHRRLQRHVDCAGRMRP
jgi:hypothetical protein